MRSARFFSRPSIVAVLYGCAAVVMTWPLATVLPQRIAGDLGDPLFNCWVLLWTSTQILQFLRGDLPALSRYWSGNIYHPAPLTLAYSEHLTPQMLQSLPVLAVTHNAVLAYNLLMLGTIVLSGLGMYLLVRELTAQPLAAFLAGLAFAFAPYRIDQWTHLEVLSSQWMPFALYGFRRFFVTGRRRALAGGAAALVAQALSCAYYLVYFTPFAVAYCLYETIARGRARDRRTWLALLGAGAGALLVVGLFLWPYLQVRRLGDVGVRSLAEVQQFSADTHAFATVSHNARLWGDRIRALPKNEGQGFPGFTILAFAGLAAAAAIARARGGARDTNAPAPGWRRAGAWTCGALLLAHAALLIHLLVTGQGTVAILGIVVRMRYRPARLALQIGALVAALLWLSPACRRAVRGTPRSTVALFGWAALVAAWLSLGPTMYVNGQPLGPGLYGVLYRWVPGFDGLRVPSLYFMIVSLFLAILAGLGAAALLAPPGRTGRLVVTAGMLAVLAEGWSVPADTNVALPVSAGLVPLTVMIDGPASGPLYAAVRALPPDAVVAEFPFGELPYEIQYTFYAGYHGKAIVNGYSGFAPARYTALRMILSGAPNDARAWQALLDSGATHAVVHENAYINGKGAVVSSWLRRSGAREVAAVRTARVFALRPEN